MTKYDKYIGMEFGYFDERFKEQRILLYGGIKKGKIGWHCYYCEKHLKTIAHIFIDQHNDDIEYLFGSECVKHVFVRGLRTQIPK